MNASCVDCETERGGAGVEWCAAVVVQVLNCETERDGAGVDCETERGGAGVEWCAAAAEFCR